MTKRFFLPFLSILLLFTLCVPVSAQEEKGSIEVTIPGDTMTLYRVGTMQESGSYQTMGDFTGWEGTLEELQSPELAAELAAFAAEAEISGTAQEVGRDETVTFSNLEAGLYLLVHTPEASSQEYAAPFLVSLPNQEDGRYIYNVHAAPKSGYLPVPTEPAPESPNIPQTGQLRWPVPLFTVSGLILFGMGLAIRKRNG